MPAREESLQLRVKAIDEASGVMGKVAKTVREFGKEVKKESSFAKNYSEYQEKFTQSVADLNRELTSGIPISQRFTQALGGVNMEAVTGALKLAGFAVSVALVSKAMKEITAVAGQLETSLMGISATARIFGHDAELARKASKSLTEDGLINQIEAAEGLQSIMMTGLGLEEAIILMERLKDMAAFGGKTTIAYNDKVRMLSESFRTGYSIQAKNAGMMMTWKKAAEIGAEKMGKLTKDLTLGEVAMARYLGVMEVTAGETGQSALITETYAGAVASLKTAKMELSAVLGEALLPAFKMFSEVLVNIMEKLKGLKVITQAISSLFLGLSFLAKEVGNFISGVVAQIINEWRILIEEAQKITLDPRTWLKGLATAGQRMTAQTQSIWNVVKEDAWQIALETQEGLNTIWGKGLEDITSSIGEASNEWLNTLSEAARAAAKRIAERLAEIARRIEEETRRFQHQMELRSAAFKRSMADMIFAHRDKTKALEKELAKETKAFEKAKKKIQERYEKETKQIKVNLKKQLALAHESDETLIALAKKTLQEKADERDKALAEEQEEHDERLSEIKTELAEELDIYKKHKADFDALKDQSAEDDITRLKKAFERELAEMRYQHQKRLEEFERQRQEITAGKKVGEIPAEGPAGEVYDYVVKAGDTLWAIAQRFLGAGNRWREIQGYSGDPQKMPIGTQLRIPRAQEGLMVPGRGAVPILAHGGETILTRRQTEGLLKLLEGVSKEGAPGFIQKNYIQAYLREEVDIDTLMRRLAYRGRLSGD